MRGVNAALVGAPVRPGIARPAGCVRMTAVAVEVSERDFEQLGHRRGTLLGLYQGVDLTRRSPLSYVGAMPDRITVFRGPITRLARDRSDLVRIVTTTVIHEVAHHFGISDARLEELGWA